MARRFINNLYIFGEKQTRYLFIQGNKGSKFKLLIIEYIVLLWITHKHKDISLVIEKDATQTVEDKGFCSKMDILDIIKLEDKIKKYQPFEDLQSEYLQLRNDVRQMKESMSLSDSDSDDSDIPVMDDTKE